MKFLLISDTHERHRRLPYLNGTRTPEMNEKLRDVDVLIHSGDFTKIGSISALYDFADWLSDLPIHNKIVVAGNHDKCFEDYDRKQANEIIESVPGMHYLEDEACNINGVNFYGSPWTPTWGTDWSFNVDRDSDKEKMIWDQLPEDTDVLVCHGPPYGYVDRMPDGRFTGSKVMLERMKIVKPKLTVCGHIHEAAGVSSWNGLTVVNASMVDFRLREGTLRDPIFFEMDFENEY